MATITDEFEIPSFLGSSDEDEIHENEILSTLPNEYDKSEGQVLYDITRPTANIASLLRGYEIPEALKLIWPRFANGIYLDYHAETRNMIRKEATYATGILTISGKAGTNIPLGSVFSTETKNNVASVDYATTVAEIIGEDGTVDVAARAVFPGPDGNAGANQITIKSNEIDDISAVTNKEAFTGGYDEEDDESLKQRLIEYDLSKGESNIGNKSDYKRWALEIVGVGDATVITPQDDSGLITLVLTDMNGSPANEVLCETVYNHIMGVQDNEHDRLAPINARLEVIPPQTINVSITATIELDNDTSQTITSITSDFTEALMSYFPQAISDAEIRYEKVKSILSSIDGVYDFKDVYINSMQGNIILASGVLPITDESKITLTEDDV